jgi:hypothetical protein
VEQLAIPEFSISEAMIHLDRQRGRRRDLSERLTAEFDDSKRSERFRHAPAAMHEASGLLTRAGDDERAGLDAIVRRVLAKAELIRIDPEIWDRAGQLIDLSPQDGLVFASVIVSLERSAERDALFVSRDARAFGSSGVVGELELRGCKSRFRFDDALRFVQRAPASA